MTWSLVCDTCARGEEIKSIGVIRQPPAQCACCGVELPVMANGLVGCNPVADFQLARIRARVNAPAAADPNRTGAPS